MSTIEEIRARLRAFCSERIAWPAGAGIAPARRDIFGGPYVAGTAILAAGPGRIVAEHGLDEARASYDPPLPDDLLRAVGAYYAAHRGLFLAQEWREAFLLGRRAFGEDTLPALQADVRDLLAEVDRLSDALARLAGAGGRMGGDRGAGA